MLELLAIFGLYRYLDRQLIKKNLPTKHAFLGPILWILFEVVVGFGAGIMGAKGGQIYLAAVFGAFLGGLTAIIAVACMPSQPLACPSCEETFLRRGTEAVWRSVCESCATPLRIVNGVVKVSKPIKRGPRSSRHAP